MKGWVSEGSDGGVVALDFTTDNCTPFGTALYGDEKWDCNVRFLFTFFTSAIEPESLLAIFLGTIVSFTPNSVCHSTIWTGPKSGGVSVEKSWQDDDGCILCTLIHTYGQFRELNKHVLLDCIRCCELVMKIHLSHFSHNKNYYYYY